MTVCMCFMTAVFFGCYNALDGTAIYEHQRIPEARNFTASPWANDGKIFCLNEDGVTYVMKAGDQLEFLYTNTLAEDDMGMATPAISGDRLLIRTSARMYCVRNATGSKAAAK